MSVVVTPDVAGFVYSAARTDTDRVFIARVWEFYYRSVAATGYRTSFDGVGSQLFQGDYTLLESGRVVGEESHLRCGVGSGGTPLRVVSDGIDARETVCRVPEGEKQETPDRWPSCGSVGGADTTPQAGGMKERVDKTMENRAKREKEKARKQRKKARQMAGDWRSGGATVGKEKEVDADLKESSKQKWIAQNRLAALKAQRELEVLESNDIDAEKKRYRTKVRVQTERNMVAIEKTHATLKATDNVSCDELDAEDAGSRVCTLVTDNSGSISPNSSVSEAEVRKMQKDFADLQAKNEVLRECLKKFRLDPDCAEFYGKDEWTLNSQGTMDDERKEILDEVWPGGFFVREEYEKDGKKMRIIRGFD